MPRASLTALPDELLHIIFSLALHPTSTVPFHPLYSPPHPPLLPPPHVLTSLLEIADAVRARDEHRAAWRLATALSRRLRRVATPLFFATRWLVLSCLLSPGVARSPRLLLPGFAAEDAAAALAAARDVVLVYAGWPEAETKGTLPPREGLAATLRLVPHCRRAVVLWAPGVHAGEACIRDVEDLFMCGFDSETHVFEVDKEDGRRLALRTLVPWEIRYPDFWCDMVNDYGALGCFGLDEEDDDI